MTALVVSDVHLDGARPEIARQFTGFLGTEARGARALYILGDLFEVWIGDDDPDPHKREVIAALRGLTQSGVALYLMHGNRDFLLGERFCDETGGTLLTDPTIVEIEEQRALLTHGDALCTDDVPYQRLRALVRDPAWQAQFLALSVDQRQALAVEARAGSKAHTATQQTMLMDVNTEAVAAVFRDAGVDTIVHGHTHRPGVYLHAVDGRPRKRIVTGDWYTQGSVLRWDAAGLTLAGLPRA
ncbi:MAG TPA: UDP-2,3-diacylglucosamine diphosphatase [Steroidobacteraceae bacterium]|nr:UDP-2,3-diacylglucosamine diphosphatase [Steroidobacteraceae bacterium]